MHFMFTHAYLHSGRYVCRGYTIKVPLTDNLNLMPLVYHSGSHRSLIIMAAITRKCETLTTISQQVLVNKGITNNMYAFCKCSRLCLLWCVCVHVQGDLLCFRQRALLVPLSVGVQPCMQSVSVSL